MTSPSAAPRLARPPLKAQIPATCSGRSRNTASKYPHYQGALYTLDIGGNDIDNALGEFAAGQITSQHRSARSSPRPRPTRSRRSRRSSGSARANLLFYEAPDLGLTPHFRAEGVAWQNLAERPCAVV